jgi:hypothetical protein
MYGNMYEKCDISKEIIIKKILLTLVDYKIDMMH